MPSENEKLASRKKLDIKQTDKVVAFVGGGFARKGLRQLLESFPTIQKYHPATLLVAGSDKSSDDYRQQCESLGIADQVRFLGNVAGP